uniref:NADH-ubiquinone oxidoreductase chain 5 n=1 Tax=Aspidophiura sp. TaxID=3135528 RepID=A0AAU6QCR8_9ECHI
MFFSLLILLIFITILLSSLFTTNNNEKIIVSCFGFMSGLALLILGFYFMGGCPSILVKLNWYSSSLQSFHLSFLLDFPFILFLVVALFVSWSILSFSIFYMAGDPNIHSFILTLVLFLFFMLILTSANSLFLLFVGWEGVGVLSFVLIGWWHTRALANSAALQAIIYNRIGDSGIILFMALSILFFNSWELSDLTFLSLYSAFSQWALLGIVLAATGKSAQFLLHPWLPAAMEGPTPVSALLHSSTMVVAGVFLLIRCFPIFSSNSLILSLLVILGSLTAFFAGSVAIFQYDLKKIIAYSTTSQLGLMFVSVGLGFPNLALFHICTHAFFKSLLFLCSGSIIHSSNNEQDIRKLTNLVSLLPFTSCCFLIGSITLCGFPFLAGFYSKDLIMEIAQFNNVNMAGVIFTFISIIFTIIYSIRILFFLTLPSSSIPTIPISEENWNLILPLFRLVLGTVGSGWFLVVFFFDFSSPFLPYIQKSAPLIAFFYFCPLFFFVISELNIQKGFWGPVHLFLSNAWFYQAILHGPLLHVIHNNSLLGVLRTLDQGWLSSLGPTGLSKLVISLALILQRAHTGLISKYLFFLFLFSIIIFLLLLFF